MPGARSGPLEVDQFCRRLADQIQAAAACDDDAQCAAMLRTLAGYLAARELEIRQTAWDADRAPPPKAIRAMYAGTCVSCRPHPDR